MSLDTSTRRAEILQLPWGEVDLSEAVIRLPAARSKVKQARGIPLSPPAVSILQELPRVDGANMVFSLNGQRPVANVERAKSKLDQKMAEMLGAPVPNWRLHDIRRTVATGLQRLGVRLEVIEAALGHVAGSRAGIVGVYQRHRFKAETREALAL